MRLIDADKLRDYLVWEICEKRDCDKDFDCDGCDIDIALTQIYKAETKEICKEEYKDCKYRLPCGVCEK